MGGSCLGSITSYFASLNVQLPKPPVSNLGITSPRHCSGRHTGVQFTARLIMDVSLQAQLPAPYLSPCIWRWLRAGYGPAWGWRLCFQGPDVAETTRCFHSTAFRMSKFGSNKYYSPPCYEPLPPCWGKHGAGRNSVPGMGGSLGWLPCAHRHPMAMGWGLRLLRPFSAGPGVAISPSCFQVSPGLGTPWERQGGAGASLKPVWAQGMGAR